ncbi:hypothetical protein LCGC14_0313470 [marine sediment metagenome]|uniref:Uncharacterized protein n=1 Tax=marine sediment metagenome TaxID=412755 RepID=A0A0F9TLQ4_9ZZZZ
MPATAAKIVQISTEPSWGTSTAPATATIKVHGITDATLKIVSVVEPISQVGWFGPGPVAQEQAHSGEATWDLVMTYEESPRILNGFFTAIGASTTTTAPYNYPYTAPITSTQVVRTYGIEYGTSGLPYKALGSVAKHFNITGEAGGFWNGRVDWIAKQIVVTSQLTTGLDDRTVRPVRVADTRLYISAFSTGTIGATGDIVSDTLISFDFDMETNRHLKQFAGAITPADWGDGKFEGTLKFIAEFNSNAKALVDELLGSTGAAVSRQIRLEASQGTSSEYKEFNIDFAGIKTEGELLYGDRDGNMTVEFTFMGRYSTGLGNWLAMNVQNGSSSTT